jgi:hypothetical protein
MFAAPADRGSGGQWFTKSATIQPFRVLPFDGGMLLVAGNDRLLIHNESAYAIWHGINAGLGSLEIAAALARSDGANRREIQKDVESLLARWRAQGVFGGEGVPSPAEATSFAAGPVAWAAEWTCRVHGHTFHFAVEDPARATTLRHLLQHLEVPSTTSGPRFEVRTAGHDTAIILQDGDDIGTIYRFAGFKDTIHGAMIRHIWPAHPLVALSHGGSVSKDGAAICFPAISGGGKSTLVAYLVRQGFGYFSDDMAAVDDAGRIIPWPLPLRVKEGSWKALEPVYPELPDIPVLNFGGRGVKLLIPNDDSWDARPLPLSALVFPKYRPESETEVTKLRPFQALEQLVEAGTWFGYPLLEDNLRSFLSILERVPAYTLTYSRLEEAAKAVRDVTRRAS